MPNIHYSKMRGRLLIEIQSRESPMIDFDQVCFSSATVLEAMPAADHNRAYAKLWFLFIRKGFNGVGASRAIARIESAET